MHWQFPVVWWWWFTTFLNYSQCLSACGRCSSGSCTNVLIKISAQNKASEKIFHTHTYVTVSHSRSNYVYYDNIISFTSWNVPKMNISTSPQTRIWPCTQSQPKELMLVSQKQKHLNFRSYLDSLVTMVISVKSHESLFLSYLRMTIPTFTFSLLNQCGCSFIAFT